MTAAPERLPAVGIDIGGTKVAGGLVAPDGTVLDTARRATPGSSVVETEDAIVAVVEELTARAAGPVVGVGIGAAGWFDRTGDTVLFSPHLAWRNSSLRKDLAARLQQPLWVGNDADAAAWAEYRYGAARGADLALMITLGTGIGGGIVLDGRLRRGSHGVAGEWGHMRVVPDGRLCACGNRGCWEQYSSGPALMRAATERSASFPDGPALTEAARAGDGTAVACLADVGEWLGQGLADISAMLDPGRFVVGGGVAEAGELLLAPARERYARALTGRGHRPPAEIVAASLGADAGMVGAAELARERRCGS